MVPPALAGFTIGERIGTGGFASVWSAVRSSDGVRVAIKIAHLATNATARRFAREAGVLAELAGEPIPAMLGTGEDASGRPYLVLELLVGRTLAAELAAADTAHGEHWAAQRGAQIAAALARLHQRGVVHRDIKPENVFVEPSRIVLLDLGLVRIPDAGETLTRAGAIVGTPEYMAPDAGEPGPPCDVYALGVVLFKLLTDRLPFEADGPALELAHRALRPPNPSTLVEVSAELDELVVSCLAKDPARRPLAASLASELAELAERARDAPRVALARSQAPSPSPSARPEPLVLVQIPYSRRLPELVKLVVRHHGVLAERDDVAAVFAFPWLACDHPMRSALAAAVSALAAGFAPVIHLAPAIAKRNARGQIIVQLVEHGTAASWRPTAVDGSSILLTATAMRALPTDHAATDAGDGYYRVVEPESIVDVEATLFGRDELVQAATAHLRRAVAGEESLLVLGGDAGTGKTRLLREIIDEATRICPAIMVHRLAGAGELPPPSAETPQLLVLDDAHDASPALLDAIEAATAGGQNRPLLCLVAGTPQLAAKRPRFGERAQYLLRLDVRALDEPAAMALAAELLRPAEYPREDLLRMLASWCGGNPYYLVELVAALKRQGLVRKRESGEGWYVAGADLAQIEQPQITSWVARKRLDALGTELAALARACACLEEVDEDTLDAIQRQLDPSSLAASKLDTSIGLRELARHEILVPSRAGRWTFAATALRDAIRSTIPAQQIARIYELALGSLAGDDAHTLASRATYAHGCGRDALAADAYLALAELEQREGFLARAEVTLGAALALLDANDMRRSAALHRRGVVRYQLHRISDAFDDLRAVELASADPVLRAEAVLDAATALDWAEDFSTSAQRVEDAAAIAAGHETPRLHGRIALGRARHAWRRGELDAASSGLETAVELARNADDQETLAIAYMLLGCAETWSNRHASGRRCFDAAIAICSARNDDLHRCAALVNRTHLWFVMHDIAACDADLREAIHFARRCGHPMLERVPSFNLAELLHCAGRGEEALPLAKRSADLQRRFSEHRNADDRVLLARIYAALDRRDEARAELASLDDARRDGENPATAALWEAVELVLADGSAAAWPALVDRVRGKVSAGEHLELYWWWAQSRGATEVLARDDSAPEIAKLLATWPIWRARLAGAGLATSIDGAA